MANFTFETGIPAAGNNPSVDQPDMLINNQSTDGILAIDHVSFNANDGGTHKQVTFAINQAGPALPGATVSELYSNLNNGMFGNIASVFFKNATRDLPLFNLALVTTTPGATGFGLTTPWGLIFNFGFATTGTSLTTFTFQTSMANNQYALLIGTSSSNASRNVTTQNFGAASFDAIATNAGTGFHFLAIGR